MQEIRPDVNVVAALPDCMGAPGEPEVPQSDFVPVNKALWAFAALAFHSFTFAQDDSGGSAEVIGEIVVDGTRLGQLATETGSSISIIDADELEALGFNFVADALAAAPGLR